MSRRLAAEFIGTFWLVLGGCGAAVLAAGVPMVGIGYAGFRNPSALVTIIDDLEKWCERRGIAKVSELIGAVRDDDMEKDTLRAASAGV